MDTTVSGVESFKIADLIASSEPFESAFKTIFNCFKFQDFILFINNSNVDFPAFFCLSSISLYSSALFFAVSGLFTTCKIAHHSTTLSNQTIKTGSPGFANFTFSCK
jgi:hypothetical protein